MNKNFGLFTAVALSLIIVSIALLTSCGGRDVGPIELIDGELADTHYEVVEIGGMTCIQWNLASYDMGGLTCNWKEWGGRCAQTKEY